MEATRSGDRSGVKSVDDEHRRRPPMYYLDPGRQKMSE